MKVGVVTRNLMGTNVVTAVIEPPSSEVDSLDHYFLDIFEDIKEDFCSKFVEFKDAIWDLQIIGTQR